MFLQYLFLYNLLLLVNDNLWLLKKHPIFFLSQTIYTFCMKFYRTVDKYTIYYRLFCSYNVWPFTGS